MNTLPRCFRRLLGLLVCLKIGLCAAPTAPGGPAGRVQADPRPNILLILIDDHAANMVSFLGESVVRTPNIDRLAARSAWFYRAYCPAPVCSASRASFLTGVHPSKSGVYYNSQAYRRTDRPIARAATLQGHFRQQGYLTAGYGKVNHTAYQDDNLADFTPGYFKGHRFKKYVRNTDEDLLRHVIPETFREPDPAYSASSWGALPDDWDRDDPEKWQEDTEQASRAVTFLGERHEQPFFLTCGFWRPHSIRIVPQRYYDLYPLDSIEVPKSYRAGDLEDVAAPNRHRATKQGTHAQIVRLGLWREYLRSYYAATTYVDEQVGRVLDALERSTHARNTIVVFASDNGYHGGEKDMWSKFALWEQTNRVVLAIQVPGLAPQLVPSPVSLLDLYPTLLNLCGLPRPSTHELDGLDLGPILRGERVDRGAPVLSTYGQGNHSIRDWRFRYTRFRNGEEELYDHERDPYEWTNLAAEPRYAAVKARLRQLLPTQDAPEIEPAVPWDGSELRADLFEQWQPRQERPAAP